MAKGTELAVGYVSLVAETKDLSKGIDDTFAKAGQTVERHGQKAGQSFNRGAQRGMGRLDPRNLFRTDGAEQAGSKIGRDVSNGVKLGFQRNFPGLGALMGGTGVAGGAAIAGIAALTAGVGAFGLVSVKGAQASIDFQRELNALQGASGATAAEMQKVSDTARAMGRDTGLAGISAGDAAQAMKELVKGGFSVNEAMDAVRGTLQLSTAAQVSGAQAAQIQANALNAFHMKATEASRAADILSNVSVAASGEITDFAYGVQAGSAVAASLGIDLDDLATALGLMAKNSIIGSDAGTLLKSALLALESPSDQAASALADLGVDVWDPNGNFRGLPVLFQQLQDAFNRMTPEAYAFATSTAFGSDAARLAGIAAHTGAQGFNELNAEVNKAGGATRIAEANMKGLPGVVENIKNSVSDLLLSVGDGLDEPLQTIGTGINEQLAALGNALNDHKPEVIEFFTDASTYALRFGQATTLAFGAVLDGLGTIMGALGQLAAIPLKLQSFLARITGDTESADEMAKMADEFWSFGDSVQNAGKKMEEIASQGGTFDQLIDKVKFGGENMALGEKAIRDFGDAILDVNDNGQLVVRDNLDEVIPKLDQTQFKITQIPGTKDFVVEAKTAEAGVEIKKLTDQINAIGPGKSINIGARVGISFTDTNGTPISATIIGQLLSGQANGNLNTQAANPFQLPPPASGPPAVPGNYLPFDPAKGGWWKAPGKQEGGSIAGPGGIDKVPAWLTAGEHVLTTEDVAAMGGQAGVYAFRKGLQHYKSGGNVKDAQLPWPGVVGPTDKNQRGGVPDLGPGKSGSQIALPDWSTPGQGWGEPPSDWWTKPVNPDDVLFPDQWGQRPWGPHPKDKRKIKMLGYDDGGAVAAIDAAYRERGRPYALGPWDCSMYMSTIYAAMAGKPPGRYFTTESGEAAFEALGFKRGYKPGALNIGMRHGGAAGGHMAGTLPNGVNVENSSMGSVYGPGASGATEFGDQWYFDGPTSGIDMLQNPTTMPNQPGAAGGNAPGGSGQGQMSPMDILTGGMSREGTGAPGGGQQGAADPYATAGGTGDSGRTEGLIPASAGNTGVAGTSFAAKLFDMGNQAVAGAIDTAADLAKMGASAGMMAAGAPGGGAGASMGIDMLSGIAKRGVSYGFQMAAIGTDALIEQLTPFGAPRWLGYDYTGFIPQLPNQGAPTTTAEKAVQQQQTQPGGQPAPAGGQHMQPGATEGVPVAPGPDQPGGPVQPGQLPGGAQPTPGMTPAPGKGPGGQPTGPLPGPPSGSPFGQDIGGGGTGAPFGQPAAAGGQDPNSWMKGLFGFDEGGIMEPGTMGVNMTKQPEAVFNADQWGVLQSATEQFGAAAAGNDYSVHLENVSVSDVGELKRELDSRQRLQMMQHAGRP